MFDGEHAMIVEVRLGTQAECSANFVKTEYSTTKKYFNVGQIKIRSEFHVPISEVFVHVWVLHACVCTMVTNLVRYLMIMTLNHHDDCRHGKPSQSTSFRRHNTPTFVLLRQSSCVCAVS